MRHLSGLLHRLGGEQPPHEIPNLDAQTESDLRLLASMLYEYGSIHINKLIRERHQIVAQYCLTKAEAMNFRVNGLIDAALKYEKVCDGLYDQLPADWRW